MRRRYHWIKEIFHNMEMYGHKKDFQDEFRVLLMDQVLDANMCCIHDDSGDSLLHCAAASGNVPLVAYLLIQPCIHVAALNNSGKKADQVICTHILASSDTGREIIAKKIKHNVLSGPTSRYEVFYSCQNRDLKAFETISDMFKQFHEFQDSKPMKRKAPTEYAVVWPVSPGSPCCMLDDPLPQQKRHCSYDYSTSSSESSPSLSALKFQKGTALPPKTVWPSYDPTSPAYQPSIPSPTHSNSSSSSSYSPYSPPLTPTFLNWVMSKSCILNIF